MSTVTAIFNFFFIADVLNQFANKNNKRLNESFYIFYVTILVYQYNLEHKQKHLTRSKHA